MLIMCKLQFTLALASFFLINFSLLADYLSVKLTSKVFFNIFSID